MLASKTYSHIKIDPETPKTQLVIVTGFLVIAAIFQDEDFAYVALLVGILSLAIKPAGYAIVWFWYKLAELMSKIMNPLILSLMYFVFITPIAFLFRLFGNDPMQFKKQEGSFFVTREFIYKKKDLENPW